MTSPASLNCINCKINITDEEVDLKCEDCYVYLCNDCSFDDNVLYKYFAYYSYGYICVTCHYKYF